MKLQPFCTNVFSKCSLDTQSFPSKLTSVDVPSDDDGASTESEQGARIERCWDSTIENFKSIYSTTVLLRLAQ